MVLQRPRDDAVGIDARLGNCSRFRSGIVRSSLIFTNWPGINFENQASPTSRDERPNRVTVSNGSRAALAIRPRSRNRVGCSEAGLNAL